MHFECFELTLRIPGASSLKEKRRIINSLKQRCKARFNISVVECNQDNKWQTAHLGFAVAALSDSIARNVKQSVIDFIIEDARTDIIDIITT